MGKDPDPNTAPDCEADDPNIAIRSWLDALGFNYEPPSDEIPAFRFQVRLNRVEGHVTCGAEAGSIAFVCFRYPFYVPEDRRAGVGELLHRLNYAARRMLWDMDYNDGEVRVRLFTDIVSCSLSPDHFGAVFSTVLRIADTGFDFIAAVSAKTMRPDFAADQALAAFANAGKEDTSDSD